MFYCRVHFCNEISQNTTIFTEGTITHTPNIVNCDTFKQTVRQRLGAEPQRTLEALWVPGSVPGSRRGVVMVSYALVTATNERKFMIYFMSTC